MCDLHHISGICFATSASNNDYRILDQNLWTYWRKQERYYQIANIQNTVCDGSLTFDKAIKKGGFRYSLRKSRTLDLTFHWCDDDGEFTHWYLHCYDRRMQTLGVKAWSYELLKDIYKKKYGKLLLTKDSNGEVVYGIFCLTEDTEIIIFALAAKDEFHSSGVSIATIEYLYLYAESQDIQTINWQGSGGNSGVFKFKQSWNAEKHNFDIHGFTRLSDNELAMLRGKSQDLYVMPSAREQQ